MTSTNNNQNYFLSQPHQPFFILGIINAIIMMLVFGLSYKGIVTLNMSISNFHIYSVLFLVFTNLFTGFLFTTFPRFCQADSIDKNYYTTVFYINLVGTISLTIALFISHILLMLSMLSLFVAQVLIVIKLYTIYKNGFMQDKQDAYWILIAQYFGLLGHFLFILIELTSYINIDLNIQVFATSVSFYIYIIFLAFSVGQRMIPFFSNSYEPKSVNFVKYVFILFILKILFIINDIKIAQIFIDLVLSGYLLKEFISWKLPMFSSPAILWVLHLALFWLPVSFLLSAISLSAEILFDTSLYFLNTHLLAIGFLTTVLIGFGTRVAMGHGGLAPHADRYMISLFWFVQVVVVLRALFSFNIAFAWDMNFLFDISFTAWIVLFVLWAYKFGGVLIFGAKKK
ncbi:MAG: NnrS family protein [Arcobacteraceae bacterium]|nr:NnrS family protein [Arcobacteraceae bacterium]